MTPRGFSKTSTIIKEQTFDDLMSPPVLPMTPKEFSKTSTTIKNQTFDDPMSPPLLELTFGLLTTRVGSSICREESCKKCTSSKDIQF
jgi:hypothetical protein